MPILKASPLYLAFCDVETVKKAGRRQFAEMTKLLKHRPNLPVLVEKTDRLLRNLSDYGTLEQLDIEIHLVKEGEILSKESKSHQKFIHGIKVLMAKNFLDNLSEEVRKGHAEKIEQGGYPAKAPLGYRNNTATKEVEIDHVKAPYIVRMFELAATGNYSLPHIRKLIAKEGLTHQSPTVKLSKSHIARILRNPFTLVHFYGGIQVIKANIDQSYRVNSLIKSKVH